MATPKIEKVKGDVSEDKKLQEQPETGERDVLAEEAETEKTSAPAEKVGEKETPSEEVTETAEAPEKAVTTPAEKELTEEDEKLLSDRAQKRIRQLSEKAKRADELEKEIEVLRTEQEKRFVGSMDEPFRQNQPTQDVFSPTQPATRGTPNLPWGENSEEERVVTPEEYKRELFSTADALVQARLSQYAKAQEIKADLERVEQKYSELDPDSSEYSEELSKKVSSLFEVQLRADPQAKLSRFIDEIMSLRKSGEDKAKAQVTAKVVEQKAEEAVSPHEVEPEPEKSFETMTLDEKERYMKEHGLW